MHILKTALITGASSGLGIVFAKRLAARGINLIISARRTDRLEALAKELRNEYQVEVQVVTADLSKPEGVAALVKTVGKAEVDMLVNNAGLGQIAEFATEDVAGINAQLQVNVVALTQLTRHYLSSMLLRNQGAIINVASTAAYQPVPNMAVYAATKAYVLSFTEALWGEVRGCKVQVLALSPGGTATEFFDVAGGRLAAGKLDTPENVVDTALGALENGNRRASVIVGGANAVMAFATRLVSRGTVIKMAGRIMKPNGK